MSLRNVELQTVALHVGSPNYALVNTGTNIPLPKAGVLTNPGISIFGDAVNGEKATVTIYPPHADSNQPSILSLFVDGNTRLRGDSQSDYGLEVSGGKSVNSVYIHGDLYVSGKIDGGNKGRLFSRFTTADSLPAKPFDIRHPSKEGWRLRHVSLEGPESAVFYRGRLTGSNTIELPYYWKNLVHEDSITVSIQPIGSTQKIIVMEYNNEKVILSGNTDCFFHVFGERKDVNSLLSEYEGNNRYDYPDPNFNENSEISVENRNYTDPNHNFPRNTITS
tara:strand:+ start:654 stop:1487 length:834 start_codon:yes stop_codon:yes gene_type:complete